MLNLNKISSVILIFLNKAGPFYFILSLVFALSGELDSKVTHLLLTSSFFGAILTAFSWNKEKK